MEPFVVKLLPCVSVAFGLEHDRDADWQLREMQCVWFVVGALVEDEEH